LLPEAELRRSLSILKTHLALEPKSTFQLFYLNRSVKSIIFKEEIEQLKNVYFDRLEIFHFLTKEHRSIELFNGRFTKEKLEILTKSIIDIAVGRRLFYLRARRNDLPDAR
jgi:ring-1,2-phenylacetyl-CoA epoxidase subunit PaaE